MNRNSVMKVILLFIIIAQSTLMSAGQLNADSQQDDEVFYWFPSGLYRFYTHLDVISIRESESYQAFSSVLDVNETYSEDSKLPPFLRGKSNSYTSAVLLQEKYKKSEGWTAFLKKSPREQMELGEKGRIPKPVVSNDQLIVWRFDDLDILIKGALDNGELSETGDMIMDKPVFSSRNEEMEEIRYAYATFTQELLSAEKIRNLVAMVAAGHGQEMNLLENETNVDLVDIIPNLGSFWTITNMYHDQQRLIDALERSGAPQQRVDEMREDLEDGFRFLATSWLLDDGIVQRYVFSYGDKNHPDTEIELFRGSTGPGGEERDKWLEMMEQRRVDETSGNLRIVSITYDKELLVAYKASREASLRQMEELDKQRQEKK